MSNEIVKYCECGCGEEVNPGNRFILGHNSRVDNSFKGRHHSDKTKKMISEAKSNPSEETRKKMSDAKKGKSLSEEHKKNISKAGIGRKATEETRKKMSVANSNPSPETRKKMSIANTGRKHSPETRMKISIANTGQKRSAETRKKMSIAKSNPSQETRKKMSEVHKRENLSDETRRKLSDAQRSRAPRSEETRRKMSESRKGTSLSDEHKKNLSKSHIGLLAGANHPNWRGGISFGQYCDKFNDRKREEIRDQYDRLCLMCGKTEIENGRKLSVHHVNYSKMQGCDGEYWLLVPLCMSCHAKTNCGDRSYWEEYIMELCKQRGI